MKHVDIYTDGACRGNPGRGGWGAILVYNGMEKEMSGGEKLTTNNRMELTAAIESLGALKEPCEVTLYSDSTYLVNAVSKGWLKNWQAKNYRKSSKEDIPNKDLWIKLTPLLEKHTITFIWVRGHNGHDYNERCDGLATAFADSL